MDDASKMLKTLMASSSQATPSSTSSSVPSYESIQKQLDELKLKAMKVDGGESFKSVEEKGVLLDSGSTHVLRPAHNEFEEENTKAVCVTLAGDEQKVLKQAPSGSILLAAEEKDKVQTIVPFGAMIDRLNCKLKWNKNGLVLVHPTHGRIKTRVRAGCPEMTDAGQAAEIIAELEMRRVEELKEKTKGLQDKLSALRTMEVKKEDWRTNLAAYAQEGCVVDGLQVLFKCPVFQDLPEVATATMVPNVEVNDKSGWEYLKELPLSRRLRKRLLRSRAWVLNLFSGKKHSADPLQELNGQVNLDTNTEVVMLNVDVLLNGGWSLMGPAYKALMWAAMSGRLKAVLGVPPVKTFGFQRQEDKAGPPRPLRSSTQPYGVSDLHPVERHRVDRETSLVARQLLLYLVAHARSHGTGVKFRLGSPHTAASAEVEKEATSLSEIPLMKAFLEVTMPLGMKRCSFDKGTMGSPGRAATTFVTNLPFEAQDQLREQSSNNEVESKGGGPLRATSRDGHGYGYRYFLAASYTKPRFADQPDPAPHPPEELASDDYDFKNLDLEVVSAPGEEVDIGHGVGDVSEDLWGDLFQEGDPGDHLEPPQEEEEGEPAVHKLKAEELWDDDELAEQQQEKDKKEGEEMDGSAEVPTDHLYFVMPLKTKKSKAVMQAIQEIVLQLKHENLPVVRIHSDRAHELRSPGLREWALDQSIMLTRTEGQSPQSNGTAERAVRYLKGKARLMLRSSGLNGSHWATAMTTAAHHQREGRLRPETYEPLCPYRSRVAIKKKRYSDGGKHDLMPHWVKGTYLGPVWDVRNGSAVLEEENGRIMVTTNVRAKLHDPGTAGDAGEVELHPPARRRLRGKSKVDEHGVAVKAVRGVSHNPDRRKIVQEIIDLMAKDPVHKVTRTPVANQSTSDHRSTYATVGAYNHGGVFGLTKYTEEAKALTEKVTALLRMDFPGECFTSATVIQNTVMPTHRDLFNDFDSRNLISPLKVTSGAAVWEELKPGDKFLGTYSEMAVKDKKMPGQLHMLTGPVMINPRRWHSAVQGVEGPRLLIAGHTIGSWRKLTEEMSVRLEQLGFVMPEDPEDEAILKSAQVTPPDLEDCSLLVEEEEELLDFENFDGIAEVEQDICRCAKAAAENLYTPNVEQLLGELEGELRVVHTVHPGEVEKNLQQWIPSMMDELKALAGKGVYTVKPPSKPETNYSGGAAAEGVRLLVAEASRPPAVLVRAGLVAPDELWIALTAVYGFRSSPRWWSTYRIEMMRTASTKLGLRFEQGTAEPNIWRVLDEAGTLCGLIAVYVDDYLVAGPKNVCQDVHDWFSSTWQTTEVQFATAENPLRFLGMEMKVVLNNEGDFEGYSLDQEGYIQEVLRHHGIGERQVSTIPSAKDWMSLDSSTYPETYNERSLKEAQSVTGELAWLAQRTRPDLGFTVSVMGTLMSKDPERAAMIGRKALMYVNHTKEWKLIYKTGRDASLIAYTDSSYAPDGGRSHGGSVVFWSGAPVAWRSGRQALITTSSAETELLAASEGTTLMASIDALLHDVGAQASVRELRVDNSAAITLASEEGGSWRTRHLKVRAGALRQRIQNGWMRIAFCPGVTQLADGLT
ncbi:RE1, partial [Symbiodinium sp. KB8]